MRHWHIKFAASSIAIAIQLSCGQAALAQVVEADGGVQPEPSSGMEQSGAELDAIVVTAQRRSENINKMGLSIAALQSEALVQAGVSGPAELVKFVPGLTSSETGRGTPTFYIRGIGFDEATLGANPSVAVYTDEVPIQFAPEARFAALDVERVEVLKGPQGLLYGQNSTGGAINFIAAKPTDSLKAGLDASYGRFDTIDVRGFVSGPLSSTLGARISFMGVHSGDWQKSYTRNDGLGRKRQLAGRILLRWEPTSRLSVDFSGMGWIDKSDTLAGQLVGVNYFYMPGTAPEASAYPLAPRNARAADWIPRSERIARGLGEELNRDDNFLQGAVRARYEITDEINVTSITSLTRYRQNFWQDDSGTALENAVLHQDGRANSFTQEVRFAGDHGAIKWILGANYARDKAYDSNIFYYRQASLAVNGYQATLAYADQHARQWAIFSNFDYEVSDQIVLHAGIRYTNDRRRSAACTGDPEGRTDLSTVFSAVYSALQGRDVVIPPGGCILLDENNNPGVYRQSLQEDNISWKAGIDFKPTTDVLLYASISKGYKAGAFPNINALSYVSVLPVKQESVLAYETGFKATVMDRKVQMNGAFFYYDYSDKQLRGRVLDPQGVFGALDALVTIPKSRIWGAEFELTARPIVGLTLSANGSYVNSKIKGDFINFDPFANIINLKGKSFPHTPRWTITGRIDYETEVGSDLSAFVGVLANYQSKTAALFNDPAIIANYAGDPLNPSRRMPADTFTIPQFVTVDGQIGIKAADDTWKAWIWGKNILNRYYLINVANGIDTVYRLAGMPATYGVAVSFRF